MDLDDDPQAKPVVWHLRFLVEDSEAQIRFQHLFYAFSADEGVRFVETTESPDDPKIKILIVTFLQGHTEPENRSLRAYNRIFATAPIERRSRIDRLLDDDDFLEN